MPISRNLVTFVLTDRRTKPIALPLVVCGRMMDIDDFLPINGEVNLEPEQEIASNVCKLFPVQAYLLKCGLSTSQHRQLRTGS
jgi:hypothetical protein